MDQIFKPTSMLPLLQSIPKKTIVIDNIAYEVYLPITYQGNHLVARFNGKVVRKFVNPYEKILYEPSRIRAKARALEEAFEKINRVVEQEYDGETSSLVCQKPKASVYVHPKGMVYATMNYFCKKRRRSVLHRAYLGMKDNIKKSAIDKSVKEIAQLRATLNKEYNEHIMQLKKDFRKAVDVELATRGVAA